MHCSSPSALGKSLTLCLVALIIYQFLALCSKSCCPSCISMPTDSSVLCCEPYWLSGISMQTSPSIPDWPLRKATVRVSYANAISPEPCTVRPLRCGHQSPQSPVQSDLFCEYTNLLRALYSRTSSVRKPIYSEPCTVRPLLWGHQSTQSPVQLDLCCADTNLLQPTNTVRHPLWDTNLLQLTYTVGPLLGGHQSTPTQSELFWAETNLLQPTNTVGPLLSGHTNYRVKQ